MYTRAQHNESLQEETVQNEALLSDCYKTSETHKICRTLLESVQGSQLKHIFYGLSVYHPRDNTTRLSPVKRDISLRCWQRSKTELREESECWTIIGSRNMCKVNFIRWLIPLCCVYSLSLCHKRLQKNQWVCVCVRNWSCSTHAPASRIRKLIQNTTYHTFMWNNEKIATIILKKKPALTICSRRL